MKHTLDWHDGQPFSAHYGDIYFSRASGIAESRHVFLRHNQLAERWQKLGPGSSFVIAETGFGTGLNFLCAWQLWDQVAPPTARLHFVSAEMHPIAPSELKVVLDLWPELGIYADQLLHRYRTMAPGWHRIALAQGRVVLTLLIGDVQDTLPALQANVDAWFLDGFSPSKNPQMWTPELFRIMAGISAHQSTFATFTSAGFVRRGLEAAGFSVQKVAGHGSKREMLRGQLAVGRTITSGSSARAVVVIGAGLAGCATAHALATRGWRVTLIERHAAIAAEASGNHQGILYARLMPKMSPLSELTLAGYQFAVGWLEQMLPQGEDTWQQCGLLQLAFDAREAARLQGILDLGLPADLLYGVDATAASRLAGVELPYGGLMFPSAGWVSPPALCHALSDHPGIRLITGREVTAIERGDAGWRVLGNAGCIAEATAVVVACANHSRKFVQTSQLPLRSIRGQVTHLPATTQSAGLRTVLCTEGYVAPCRRGIHTAGATYGNLEETVELRTADHQENMDMLSRLSPDLCRWLSTAQLDVETLDGRASCRCNVVDYLPLLGAVSSGHPGLFINTGHGSRGLITALLAGEALASEMAGDPLPVPDGLMKAMSPGRFLKTKTV